MSKKSGAKKTALIKVPPSGPRNAIEAAAVARFRRRQSDNCAPTFEPAEGGEVEVDHPDDQVGAMLIAESLGSPSPSVFNGLVRQLKVSALRRDGSIDAGKMNFALGVVADVHPRDALETMLVMQMVQVQAALMDATRRLGLAADRQERESETRAINSLARTYATQLEALKRHRSNGEQRVVVQHITQHVGEGGQAIGVVGAPGDGTGEKEKIDGRSHASSSLAGVTAGAALQCAIQEERTTLSSGGDEGQAGVPHARGRRRRAAG